MTSKDIDFSSIHALALQGGITADDLPDLVVRGKVLRPVAIYAAPDGQVTPENPEGTPSENRPAVFRSSDEFPGQIVIPPPGNQYYQVFYGIPDSEGTPGNLAGAGDVAIEITPASAGSRQQLYQSGWSHQANEGLELGVLEVDSSKLLIEQWGEALGRSQRFQAAFGAALGLNGPARRRT